MIKQELFKDRSVQYTYEPGKCVTLWVSGFKIIVYKPYACKTSLKSDRVYKNPKIAMSTSMTVQLGYAEFQLINKAILEAVRILNKEGFGLINIKDWKDSDGTAHISENPYKNTPVAPKRVAKTFKPVPGDIFIDTNSNKFMCLGVGDVYERGSRINRVECNYIYLDMGNQDYSANKQGGLMEVVFHNDYYWRVDTFKHEKRGTELVFRAADIYPITKLIVRRLSNGAEGIYDIRPLSIKHLK